MFCEEEGHIEWISAWSFDGSQLLRQNRLEMIGDFPLAIGPRFEWVLQIRPSKTSTWGDAVVTRVADEQELSRVAIDLQSTSNQSFLSISPDARWLSDGNSIFNLTTGKQVQLPYYRIFGFTPDCLAVVSRQPYAPASNQADERAEPSTVEYCLAFLPIWRYLPQCRDQEQLAFVDPATGELIEKLGSADGCFLEASMSRDGSTIRAICHAFRNKQLHICPYGRAGSVDTDRNLLIWDVPAHDR